MPRAARIVCPGVPHHITQRGNRRQRTFFEPADFVAYRTLVAEGCKAAGVQVLAYCLMPNHVHLVAVPPDEDALRRALVPAHQKYTWLINRRHGWTGHLWQERFHASAMDDPHTLAAVRYVELNPVRAGLVGNPVGWAWSSASAHVGRRADQLVPADLPPPLAGIADWLGFLVDEEGDDIVDALRRHAGTGLPLGSAGFVAALEHTFGRSFARRPPGRPPRDQPCA
jgi:putative transposase